MKRANFTLIRLILLVSAIGFGLYLFYTLRPLGKSALVPVIGLPLALYLMINAFIPSRFKNEEAYYRYLDKQQEQIARISSQKLPLPEVNPKHRNLAPQLDIPVEEAALALAKPAIGFQPLYYDTMMPEDTGSWIGGLPKMRPDAAWPKGKDWDTGEITPLHFFAQIDCSKLPRDESIDFPSSGTFSIFNGPQGRNPTIIYSPSTQELREFELPTGIKPIFPRSGIDRLPKTFTVPVLFSSTPSFDHLFGSTHSNPFYKWPDWEDHIVEEVIQSLEEQHRKAYDDALLAAGISLNADFRQNKSKVHIQSGGWARSDTHDDLAPNDDNFAFLSLDHDAFTGVEHSIWGDSIIVVTKDELKRRDFSRYGNV